MANNGVGNSGMNIKQETENCLRAVSCCSPTPSSTALAPNCCAPYANGGIGSGVDGAVGTIMSSTLSPSNATTSNSVRKSSPSVSPDRQLCSSTTSLSSDAPHNMSFGYSEAHTNVHSVSSGGGGGGSFARDEMRRLCLVCGDVASGFHYGVASCEACKAFFKRTIQGNIDYTCPANNECEINKRRRKACQACRFQKCLLMGMLKEGVRLDRVRGGRQKYRRNPVSNSYQTMQMLFQTNTTSLYDVKILEVLSSYEPETLTVLQQQIMQTSAAVASSDESQQSSNGGAMLQMRSGGDVLGIGGIVGGANVTESNGIVARTAPASMLHHNNTNNSSSGSSRNNNNSEPREMLSILADIYDKELVSIIGWAKQIPGFPELPLNDQMKLLQISWAEILTLQLTFRSLPFNGKLCFANDVWIDELTAKECGNADFYYHCVQIAQRLERLSPRREEYFLLKALLLSNCDILLEDQTSLRSFRDTILNALNDVVYILRHSAAVSHQQQLLLLLPSLRQADTLIRRFWRQISADGTIIMKKLFVEMLEPVSR